MVTEHSNTVYACAVCGQPVRLSPRWDQWEHYSRTSRCTSLTVTTVSIPLPPRTNPYTEAG